MSKAVSAAPKAAGSKRIRIRNRQVIKDSKGRPAVPRDADGNKIYRNERKGSYSYENRKIGKCRRVCMSDEDALKVVNVAGLMINTDEPINELYHFCKRYSSKDPEVESIPEAKKGSKAAQLKRKLQEVENIASWMGRAAEGKKLGKTFEMLDRRLQVQRKENKEIQKKAAMKAESD